MKDLFAGSDYKPERDDERLTGQIKRVFIAMSDQRWMTLAEIESITHDPQASISAQLRHLRKPRFGAHEVNKRYVRDGLYEYQLVTRIPAVPIPNSDFAQKNLF